MEKELTTVNEFVEYLDDFISKNKITNENVEHSADLFLEFYKNNELDSNVVLLLSEISDKLKNNSNFEVFSTGYFLGLIIGKFSKKIIVKNYAV